MRIRTDIIRMYRDIHGWVGILSGLALFVAFYAGAITMFEVPLQRWASAPSHLAPPPTLEQTPGLIAKALAAHPEAATSYTIHLRTGPEQPARMSWPLSEPDDEHATVRYAFASLGRDGALQIETQQPSAVAQLIDILHQQVGLPFPHEIAMPIMGAVSLLYAVALVSGLIVLLPSFVDDLFALRFGKNLKRMWLDVHNVLGIFSLPFHLVMVFTAIVFAFHDQFYFAQDKTFAPQTPPAMSARTGAPPGEPLSPAEIVRRVGEQAPGFTLTDLSYNTGRDGRVSIRAAGTDPRHGLRGATFGVAGVNAYTGELAMTDYTPGVQDAWGAAITSFFALHFGNFGGPSVQWAYFVLGLAGAFLFYTGNLLWIETRRKKERKAGAVTQSATNRRMGCLTVGWSLGCVAGISMTIAAAKWLPAVAEDIEAWHSAIYYAVFLGAIAWAFRRGNPGTSAVELLYLCAVTTALIPLSSLASALGAGWNHGGSTFFIDVTASVGAGCFVLIAMATHRRVKNGAVDSVWSVDRDRVTASPASV